MSKVFHIGSKNWNSEVDHPYLAPTSPHYLGATILDVDAGTLIIIRFRTVGDVFLAVLSWT